MKKILFRGKRMDNGEWVYGFYVGDTGDGCHEICDINSTTGHRAEVDPDTVGQYIGLGDKKGKRIFEGDILAGAWNTRLIIFFDDDYLQFRAREVSSYARQNAIDYYNNGKMEVIGNIHDHPELVHNKVKEG